jgi:sec-independent protein translocase protein TatC
MSTNGHEAPDPEDMFNDTRMSFGDHIEELRTHLIRAIYGFVIGMIISIWPLGTYVMRIIVAPVEDQLAEFELRQVKRDIQKARADRLAAGVTLPTRTRVIAFDKQKLQAILGIKQSEAAVLEDVEPAFRKVLDGLGALDYSHENLRKQVDLAEMELHFPDTEKEIEQNMIEAAKIRRKPLTAMSITEAFFVYFKIALMTGRVLSSPWVFFQIWMFIAAGLYPHEKKLVHHYLPFSLFLFLSGVLLCQFFVMPRAIEAMLWFNEWLGIGADLRLNEWLGFALMMPLVFGISFQTPLVMMFMHRVGIVRVQGYRDYRRISWFVMAIFAALITPSVDPYSMLLLWVPMGGLYELGILLCVWQGEEDDLAEWEKEEKANELVEV